MAEQESAEVQAEGQVAEATDFSSLLNKEFKPKSERAKEEVESAVATLAEFVLKDATIVSDDALNSIQAVIAKIDEKLSEQVNLVMHHADFQKLEGAWRGLHHLVNNTETDEMLKIRVLNI
ncbi:MAG: type VI secretion system contractile sheath large subunit, partial [Methylomarinum sp.]|nr:type VI secretion system contractile sheath large subunit [Methylomarinum sp.]